MKRAILYILFYAILLVPMWIWIMYSVTFDSLCVSILWLCYSILSANVSLKISCWFTRMDEDGYE